MERLRLGSHPVGLVEDHRIPAGFLDAQRLPYCWVRCGEMQRHDPCFVGGEVQRVLLDRLKGDRPKPTAEELVEVRLPLGDEMSGAHDERSIDFAETLHLPQPHTRHDRLAGPRFVSQQEPQHRLRQHVLIHRFHLMRQRLQRRRRQRRGPGRANRMQHPLTPQAGQRHSR